ncbi:MAG: pentapeptide repeat-containing protein [Chloroflexota bacterium]
MSVGQAILFVLIGGVVALVAAWVAAALVSSRVRKAFQQELEAQDKTRQEQNQRLVADVKETLELQQQRQHTELERLVNEHQPETPTADVLSGPVPLEAEGIVSAEMLAIRERLLADKSARGANLRQAYLRGLVLAEADLREANLKQSNLEEADLTGANLQGAQLTSGRSKAS